MKVHGSTFFTMRSTLIPTRSSRHALFALGWLFILTAAAYDIYFAWQYRAVFQVWELNPLVSWAARVYGLPVVFGFRLSMIGLAAALAIYCHRRQHPLEMPLTLSLAGMHFVLSLHYLFGHMQGIAY
jgi:hypothetical protein